MISNNRTASPLLVLWELLLLINRMGKDQLQPVALIEEITVFHSSKSSFKKKIWIENAENMYGI